MKFYDCKTAPSPRRVRVFMAEKGVELETVQVDLGSGEQFSQAFRKINPDCVVPVLQLDDGTILSEVVAICDFLESQFPDPPLMGSTPIERAQVLMCWMAAHTGPHRGLVSNRVPRSRVWNVTVATSSA